MKGDTLTQEQTGQGQTGPEQAGQEQGGPALPRPARIHILGVGVSVVGMNDVIRQCDELIRSNGRGYICATDVHSVVEGLRDPAHRKILNQAYLTVPDGMPLVWLGQLRGSRAMRRVYGPDLMLALCDRSAERGWRHFFYGGKAGVAEKLQTRLTRKFPGLQVVGTYTPPFRPLTPVEEAKLTAQVEQAEPDVFWVGLGAPKQERFMAQHCGILRCPLMVGVGAAFDFHSGTVREAPRWLHSTGLQWAYRLMQEPRRLGRRYLDCIPAFLWNVALEASGIRIVQPELR
jgi:N-acetylglucosaminyldiphosphoundecaprenol N-acetyl-beta-D-mannosaminyltransferase